MNGEKPIRESEEVMAELGIGLDLELKRFHIISTGTESISHSLHNLTNNIYNIYATANNSNNNSNNNNNNNNNNKNNNKKIVNSRQKFLSVETLSDKNKNKKKQKNWVSYKTVLTQTTWDLHFDIPYCHFAKEKIILWKQNIQTLN